MHANHPRTYQQRISWIALTMLLLFAGLVIRLFYWQIINGNTLRLTATAQYEEHLKIPARRGDIMASDGSPLSVNQPSFLVYAEPKRIKDPNYFSRQVADALSEQQLDVQQLISIPGRQWVSLSNSVDAPTKQKLDALHLDGIGFENRTMRYYPEASMAAHLLGFVGLDADGNQKGYFGLEGYYDRELSGQTGSLEAQHDAKGNPILIGDQTRVEAHDGRSLLLWVDRSIQYAAEKRLAEGIQKYGANSGSVVIMDPHTGGILAMASIPTYDPAHYQQFNNSDFKNAAVADSYEPGSTFKPLIMAAAINEGLINPQTTMNESGPVQIGEYSIHTWNDSYHGTITMTQILEYSSNVGMVFVSRQLGKAKELQYIQNYGFGEKTGIDLQDESSPDLRPPSSWTDIDYATSSFGQGIAATPLQVVRAIATIANDGWLMEPHVVKEIIDKQGKKTEIKDKKVRQIFSSNTAQLVKQMMVDAVNFGEAKWAKPKGYKVAGKTGTAQIPIAGHYDKDKTIASFVGFAPADNPKFVMLVRLDQPKTSIYGAETAAPLFFVIAKDLFAYMGIGPTGDN